MIPQPQKELPKSRVVPKPPRYHEDLYPEDTTCLNAPGEYLPLVHAGLDWASFVLEKQKKERE